MLRELRIKSFAIIDGVSIEFGKGLNVLTGETGAGKSIIVDALGLALGERAYPEMIKTGAEGASVEAVFELEKNPIPGQLDIPFEDTLILRRVISGNSGKSRAYMNDTPVNIQTLIETGKSLVDIHGQHEHQSLLSQQNQLYVLDEAAGLESNREQVSALYEETRDLRNKLAALKKAERERAQRQDLLSFQVNEIAASGLVPGEEEALERERKILSSLTRLRELIEGAYLLLHDEESSVLPLLGKVKAMLAEAALIDPAQAEALSMLESALPLLEETASLVRSFRDRYEPDPGRLNEIEERLDLIKKLKRKYGASIDEILEFGEKATAELDALSRLEEDAAGLEAAVAGKETGLKALARELSDNRKSAARELGEKISGALGELAIEKAAFRIAFSEAETGPEGMDKIEFLFSANPGEPPKPLSRIASGGELSRVMLAIKGAARSGAVPVMIFDEVDAGIGGKTAASVASKLKEIAKTNQVLCITHLPQIASRADAHFMVEKNSENGATSVKIRKITGREREEEIARMLAGKITGVSLTHAKELIKGAGK